MRKMGWAGAFGAIVCITLGIGWQSTGWTDEGESSFGPTESSSGGQGSWGQQENRGGDFSGNFGEPGSTGGNLSGSNQSFQGGNLPAGIMGGSSTQMNSLPASNNSMSGSGAGSEGSFGKSSPGSFGGTGTTGGNFSGNLPAGIMGGSSTQLNQLPSSISGFGTSSDSSLGKGSFGPSGSSGAAWQSSPTQMGGVGAISNSNMGPMQVQASPGAFGSTSASQLNIPAQQKGADFGGSGPPSGGGASGGGNYGGGAGGGNPGGGSPGGGGGPGGGGRR